jgi:hypothetical protein
VDTDNGLSAIYGGFIKFKHVKSNGMLVKWTHNRDQVLVSHPMATSLSPILAMGRYSGVMIGGDLVASGCNKVAEAFKRGKIVANPRYDD